MANQCEGCIYQKHLINSGYEATNRDICSRCKATYRGPSRYQRARRRIKMVNQCAGCLYQEFDGDALTEAYKQSRCQCCKATHKGPSLYVSERRYHNGKTVEPL